VNWDQLYWRAYEDGHNRHRLGGHQLDEYAQAYADINETFSRPAPLALHWDFWVHGCCVPRADGTYHLDRQGVSHTYHEENGRVVAA